jgi:murein DD-endopeptidase MepM/ murein hydrolase activator NlpD
MEKKGVLSTLRFMLFTIITLALVCSAVVITVLNMYEPVEKTYINGKFIGYFTSEQQFDEVYNNLVTEKQNIDPNVKVYLESEPTFETSYVRNNLLLDQNLYTNLRAEIKTEYTIYEVAVDGESKMTFSTKDEADSYSSKLKKEVSDLDVEVKEEKKSELENITTIERADAILQDIVDRNKPVETPAATVTETTDTYTDTTDDTSYTTYTQVQTIGATSVAATGSGVWPTVERRINCTYMGYAGHTGTDIGGSIGTAIYAYRSGTVVFSGWGTGYGNYIKVDHGDGVATLYAHCSELLVSAGDYVTEGQMIAKIGMTGWTTGPHLHFEIRLNGVPVDAYPYIEGK